MWYHHKTLSRSGREHEKLIHQFACNRCCDDDVRISSKKFHFLTHRSMKAKLKNFSDSSYLAPTIDVVLSFWVQLSSCENVFSFFRRKCQIFFSFFMCCFDNSVSLLSSPVWSLLLAFLVDKKIWISRTGRIDSVWIFITSFSRARQKTENFRFLWLFA